MSEMETSTLDESQVEENRLSYEGIHKRTSLNRPSGPINSDTIFRTTSIGECNFNSNGFKKIDEKSIQMCQESFKGKDKWSQTRCQGIHFGSKTLNQSYLILGCPQIHQKRRKGIGCLSWRYFSN